MFSNINTQNQVSSLSHYYFAQLFRENKGIHIIQVSKPFKNQNVSFIRELPLGSCLVFLKICQEKICARDL
eukprot:snap_masked-scaffold_18-processed-gene-1.25-mRNA-1 protein AED:1.00 eAED:1.00 QI:0/0/0/0/1/1/2/0/70